MKEDDCLLPLFSGCKRNGRGKGVSRFGSWGLVRVEETNLSHFEEVSASCLNDILPLMTIKEESLTGRKSFEAQLM